MKMAILTGWLFIFSAVASAIYAQAGSIGENNGRNLKAPTEIIVRLNADIKLSAREHARNLKYTGIKSYDSVTAKNQIVQQRFLLKGPLRQRVPEKFRNMLVVRIPDGADMDEVIKDYESLDIVQYAEPNHAFELHTAPNDPLYPHQYFLHNTGQGCYAVGEDDTLIEAYGVDDADIDAQEVFDNPPDITNTVVVAVLDTGGDLDHPELAGRLWTNQNEIPDNGLDDDHNGYVDDVNGYDFCGDTLDFNFIPDNDPTDNYGHGTHIAGIITALTNNSQGVAGIVDNCKVMPLKIHPVMINSVAIEAIMYAADNGADIISMSWGGPAYSNAVEDALEYARSRGITPIASSGNSGCPGGDCTAPISFPAFYPCVIAVGATNNLDQVTDFSSFGPYVDLCAPGQDILSLRADTTDMYEALGVPEEHIIDEYYYLANGTSFSCPIAAAVAGYMRSVSPGLSPAMTQSILQATADDLVDPYGDGRDMPGWDMYSGHGRVNLLNALNAVPSLRVKIDYPAPNQTVSGVIDILGIADGDDFTEYTVDYGEGSNPESWTTLHSSPLPVTGGILCSWNTESLDGFYTIRVRSGETNFHVVTIHVSNSVIAEFSQPADNDTVCNYANIIGTASCPDMSHYVLEFCDESIPGEWITLADESLPVFDGKLGEWNVNDLSEGIYSLRLSIFSGDVIVSHDSISVYVQPLFLSDNAWKVAVSDTIYRMPTYADINNDGINEIIIGTTGGIKFYGLDGTEIVSDIPEVPGYNCSFPIAVGNLDGDGIDDFVALGIEDDSLGWLLGYPSTAPPFAVELPEYPRSSTAESIMPYVSLQDVTGDSLDEIHVSLGRIAGTYDELYCVYDPSGSFLFQLYSLEHYVGSAFLVMDLDGNGTHELLRAESRVFQFNIDSLINGNPWYYSVEETSPLLQYSHTLGFHLDEMSAVDMDFDGKPEIVVYYSKEDESGFYHYVAVLEDDLSFKTGYPLNTGIPQFNATYPPVWGDINNDGGLEFFIVRKESLISSVLAWNAEGVPLSGDSTNPVFAVPANPGNMKQLAIADMDGNGYADIVSNLCQDTWMTYKVERFAAWDYNGSIMEGWPIVTVPEITTFMSGLFRVPVIGDINDDGYVDMLSTTGNNELVFINFEGAAYNESASYSTGWRYNRRLTNVGYISEFSFLCGDVNGSGIVNLLDITHLISFLYKEGPTPDPLEAADVNNSGVVNLLDITYLIAYLYKDGPEPNCP